MGIAVERFSQSLDEVIGALKEILGDRLSTNADICRQHGDDLTWHEAEAPDAVAFVKSTEEVSKIITACNEYKVPVIAYGAGTSLEGQINAPFGGICIDMMGMDKITALYEEELAVTVQAGVTRKQLNHYLRDKGLFFPIDPGADATIGGMAATRASGTNAVRYGTIRENIINLTAVMADGAVITTGGRARKSAAGYDLAHLLVGSEGTLGVITEVTLKLHGIPEAIAGGVCSFPDVEAACNAAILTIQSGIPVARIELVDEIQIKASNRHSGLSLPEVPALFVEFHGSDAGVKEQSELFGDIASEFGGGDFEWATVAEERNRLWKARHDALWAAKEIEPGKKMIVTDACVPISRLAECVVATQKDLSDSKLTAPIVGHVGDGNFHLFLLVDKNDENEVKRAEELVSRLAIRAIEMGGTCTGEHGIGKGKMRYLELEHGAGVEIMRTIKSALDPHNIMNPGKVLRF